jgi:hypothetical protein
MQLICIHNVSLNKWYPNIHTYIVKPYVGYKYTLENSEGAITIGQSRETSNIAYTRRRQIKQKHNAKMQYVLDTTMRKQTQIK